MATLFEHAGGEPPLRRFIEIFHRSVLADPVLQPLFGAGRPEHVAMLTAFDVETFGGPDRFTKELGGFQALIDAHRDLHITEPQRQRFVDLHLAAADVSGLPDDAPFRAALESHVEFGTQVATQNSNARTDDELHPLRESRAGRGTKAPEPGAARIDRRRRGGAPQTAGPSWPTLAIGVVCVG